MKKIILAMSLLITVSSFAQISVVDTIHHKGEVFELVSTTLTDFRVTKEQRLSDLIQAVRVLGYRPCDNLMREKISQKTKKDGLRYVIVSEPFLGANENVLYISTTRNNNISHVPIGDKGRGPYAHLGWITSSDPKTRWLVLRAIHTP